MRYPVILYDNSCVRFAKKCQDIYKNKNLVIGIGGGAVIDKAKIVALPQGIIAYPTTASGAARTRRAAIWTKDQKLSIKTPKPECKKYPGRVFWHEDVRRATTFDLVAHCIDSINSPRSNVFTRQMISSALSIIQDTQKEKDLIAAGNIAGDAIDITGTHLIHQLSYPLTIHLGLPHGVACGRIMQSKEYSFIWEKIGSYTDIARLRQILSI